MALYIVGTPIGNLKDMTLRALEVLNAVDYIAAEDTRISRKLLSHYKISKPLISFHEYSLPLDLERILKLLGAGKDVAYIVDAGTPGISDPGGFLVRSVSQKLSEIPIISIPGPSALTAAISVAGIQSDKFLFLGFPPAKKGRKTFFKEVLRSDHPVVIYESPHRILRTLDGLNSIGLSMFDAVLIKEISKVYEKVVRKKIFEIYEELKKEKKIRGEFVLVINIKI